MWKTCENQRFSDNPGYGKPWCYLGGTCWYPTSNAHQCRYFKKPELVDIESKESVSNDAFKRDVERVIMRMNENICDAFCDAGCGKRLNHDGCGNPCPRNTCAKFVNFVKKIKIWSIKGLETEEVKGIVAKYAHPDSDTDF